MQKIKKNNVTAIIMIGGQSKRMGGGIKSFVKFNSKNTFERILNRIKPQIENIIVNCNEENLELNKYDIPVIKDIKLGYLGPLAGIHTGLNWLKKNSFNKEWLITLPGDTPFIPEDLITRFKTKMHSKNKIILAKSNNKIHPIIGAWHISLFESLEEEINRGVRKILHWAELHKIDFVEYNDEKYDPFFNINTKEDLKEATDIEKNFF